MPGISNGVKMFNTVLSIGLVLAAFCVAFTALFALSIVETRRKKTLRREATLTDGAMVFMFDDDRMVDATPAASQLMASGPRYEKTSDWGHLANMLGARFPNLTEQMGDLAELGKLTLTASDGGNRIKAEWRDGLARIELVDLEGGSSAMPMDRLGFEAMQHELNCLRATAQHVPLMVWRENQQGVITWANRTYLDMATSAMDPDDIAAWPPKQIFEHAHLTDASELDQPRRVAVQLHDDDTRHWFDLHAVQAGDETLFTAVPADKVVHAESTLSEFVTTLTKTFAHLPIGLAIFDRKRQLTLFNPALTDLVTLPIDFLVGKPRLFAFLDRLREKRMMPEPKDYMSWRQQMSDLEAAAVNGTYEETWALPTGQTYRVTGRPHPDGAVAFLFEDITAEISLTRRFRAELEMGQSALDSFGDAVAIFSAGGVLSMSNKAYDQLWGNDPSISLADVNLGDAISTWRQTSMETPVWNQLKEFVATNGKRTEWSARVNLRDGRVLEAQFVPMVRGATMARFHLLDALPQFGALDIDRLPAEA